MICKQQQGKPDKHGRVACKVCNRHATSGAAYRMDRKFMGSDAGIQRF
jgi:hypothetical protein